MVIKCTCGKELMTVIKYKESKSFERAIDDIDTITVFPCIPCQNKAYEDGKDFVAKQHLELWNDEAADSKHERQADRD